MTIFKNNKTLKVNSKFQVLFVCTGNACRSPMAEGILKKMLPENSKDKIHICSAGTGGFLNISATYLAIEIARENGADIQHHLSQGITNFLMQRSNLVLVMAKKHEKLLKTQFPKFQENVFLLKDFALENKNDSNPDIDDPIGQSKEFYSKIYSEIELEIIRILPEVLKRAENCIK